LFDLKFTKRAECTHIYKQQNIESATFLDNIPKSIEKEKKSSLFLFVFVLIFLVQPTHTHTKNKG
jgi:hypothetical protein